MMKNSKDMLGSTLKTAQMGQAGLKSILNRPMNPALRQSIRDQIAAYNAIEQQTHSLLRQRAWQVKELGPVAKTVSTMASRMKLGGKDQDSKIAAMVIQGNTKGVIKGMRNLNHYPVPDAPVTELAQRLVDAERQAISNMQSFL